MRALSGAFGVGDAVAFVAAFVAWLVVTLADPKWAQDVNNAVVLVPMAVFAAFFVVRLALAPYWFHQEYVGAIARVRREGVDAVNRAERERDVARNTAREHRVDALIEQIEAVAQAAGFALMGRVNSLPQPIMEEALARFSEAIRALALKMTVAGPDYREVANTFSLQIQVQMVRGLGFVMPVITGVTWESETSPLSLYQRIATVGMLRDNALTQIRSLTPK